MNYPTYKALIRNLVNSQPVTPRCVYFELCGGCQWQNVSYETQVSWKEKVLSEFLGTHVPVMPSPKIYEYRSRMDFAAAFGNMGLRPRGKHDTVIDIDGCHLISEKANKVLKSVKYWSRQLALPYYDYLNHTGFLRYAIIRQTSADDIMLILITVEPRGNQEDVMPELVNHVMGEVSVRSVWWSVYNGVADLSYGNAYRFWGNEFISEQIGSFTLFVGPNVFIQSNAGIAAACFDEIKNSICGESVLDLYSGMGAVSIFIHEKAISVLGIECNEESVNSAFLNAKKNMADNVRFLSMDVRRFLASNEEYFDTIIVDPPRCGAGKKVMRSILSLAPRKIIYMSCNPDAWRQDIIHLDGYRVACVRGYDMFPQTVHVELVAILDRIE